MTTTLKMMITMVAMMVITMMTMITTMMITAMIITMMMMITMMMLTMTKRMTFLQLPLGSSPSLPLISVIPLNSPVNTLPTSSSPAAPAALSSLSYYDHVPIMITDHNRNIIDH